MIYLLHGFGGTSAATEAWTKGDWANVPRMMDRLIGAGKIRKMIVVMPDASIRLGGAFYTDSVAAGNGEDFLTRDLVRSIDSRYRTIRRASSRGIAGHSMGGYGAIKLAMKHPDIYGALAWTLLAVGVTAAFSIVLTVRRPRTHAPQSCALSPLLHSGRGVAG